MLDFMLRCRNRLALRIGVLSSAVLGHLIFEEAFNFINQFHIISAVNFDKSDDRMVNCVLDNRLTGFRLESVHMPSPFFIFPVNLGFFEKILLDDFS